MGRGTRLLDQLTVVAACSCAVLTAFLALAVASPAAASDGSSADTTPAEATPEPQTTDDAESSPPADAPADSTDGAAGTEPESEPESEPPADTNESSPDTSSGEPAAPVESDSADEESPSGERTASGPPDPAAAPPDPTAPPGGSRPSQQGPRPASPAQGPAPAPAPAPIVSLAATPPAGATSVTIAVTEAQATTLSPATAADLGALAASMVELTVGPARVPTARQSRKPRSAKRAGAATRAHPIAFTFVAGRAAEIPYAVELKGAALAAVTGTERPGTSEPRRTQPESDEDEGTSSPPKLESRWPPTWPGGLTREGLGASSGGLGGTTAEERNRHFGVLILPRDLPVSDFPVPAASGEEVLRPLATVGPLQRPG